MKIHIIKFIPLILAAVLNACGPSAKQYVTTFVAETAVAASPTPRANMTLLVPDDYPSIQAAIDDAQDGDTIVVSPGTYTENIDFRGKNVILRSKDPGDSEVVTATIIDGDRSGSVVTFRNDETSEARLEGFTITNGFNSFGGGIIMTGNSSPTITNNTVSDNHAETGGGGLFITNNSSPTITKNTIRGNQAQFFGGGIFVSDNSSPTISENTISDNEAEFFGGGGIYIDGNSVAKVVNNQFDSNSTVTTMTTLSGFEGVGNAILVSEDSSLILDTPDDNIYSGYPTNDIYDESAKYIVYQETSGRFSGDIRRVLLDGTQSMPIVSDFGAASGPAWSPDGSNIAFSSLEFNPLDLNSRDDASSSISVVDHYGFITELIHMEGLTRCPAWSPDGTQIAFRFIRSRSRRLVQIDNASIWVMNSDGSSPTEIVSRDIVEGPSCPSWSPDGTTIAFSAMANGTFTIDNTVTSPDGGFDTTGEIYFVSPDGSNLRLLTEFSGGKDTAQGIAWSPDGSKLAFAYGHEEFGSGKPPFWHIYSINVDGSGLIQLTTEGNVNACPSWSPDGSKILFHSDRDGDYDLYIMNSDGSEQTRILQREGNQLCPVLQP